MKTYKETAYDVLTRVRQEQEERKMKQKRMKWIIPAAVMLLVLLGAGIFEIIKNRNGHSGGDAGNEEMLESALQAVGRDVVHRPVVLTSEEALTHADQRLESYKQQLNASGVPVESVHVRGNAFAMLNLETDKNELADDFREVFLYDQDNKLKGSVTLWKENGTIYESLAFGSKWFD